MAALISIAMCGEPVDQAVCGAAFDILENRVWTVLLAVFCSVLVRKARVPWAGGQRVKREAFPIRRRSFTLPPPCATINRL